MFTMGTQAKHASSRIIRLRKFKSEEIERVPSGGAAKNEGEKKNDAAVSADFDRLMPLLKREQEN
jgi:hypothetical protein